MTHDDNASKSAPITDGEKQALLAVIVAIVAQVPFYLWGVDATTPQVGLAIALLGPAVIYLGTLRLGRRRRVSAGVAFAGLALCYSPFLFMLVRWNTIGY